MTNLSVSRLRSNINIEIQFSRGTLIIFVVTANPSRSAMIVFRGVKCPGYSGAQETDYTRGDGLFDAL